MGEQLRRQFITHPGSVAIIAWDETADTITTVRQYRHPVRFTLIEAPAGLLDIPDEDYVLGAKRELAEEARLSAKKWSVLVDIFTSPGGSEECLRIFLARDLEPALMPEGFTPEAEEAVMTCQAVPRAELLSLINAGKIQSPSLVTGVLALETARLSGSLDRLRPMDAPWLARQNLS